MKAMFLLIPCTFFIITAVAQNNEARTDKPDSAKKIQIVEAACGECQFGLPGKSCDLAVRIDGHAYFVDGTDIDSHGDAHAKDGFCKTIRKAEVQGEIIDNRFKVTYFKLIRPSKKNDPKANSGK